MSPLAITGMPTDAFTSAIVSYSASPLKPHARVRPWIASACTPLDSAIFATITALRLLRSHPVRILSVTGTSTAPTTRFEYARDQRFVLEQRGARHHVAHFLRRAAHVDVDDLRAFVDVVPGGVGEHLRVRARDLHGYRFDFAIVIRTAARFFRAAQQ